jgi:hypothetical protein
MAVNKDGNFGLLGKGGSFLMCGSADVRIRGNADVRMCGCAETGKCGSADVRMCGCADTRKCGRGVSQVFCILAIRLGKGEGVI